MPQRGTRAADGDDDQQSTGLFAFKRGIAQFDALVALGHTINRRLLTVEEVSLDCFVALESVRRLGQSTMETGGQRASALRFGDERVMALMAALAQWGHIPEGCPIAPSVSTSPCCWVTPPIPARTCRMICAVCASRA